VPIVLGGTHELYRGRRFRMRILPLVSARSLAGLPDAAELPEPWSSAERAMARRMTLALHETTAAAVDEEHRRAEPTPGTRKRWRWLQTAWH
jgi:hypothetical protein